MTLPRRLFMMRLRSNRQFTTPFWKETHMFRKALLGAVALLAGSAVVASAGPKEDLQAAVKKLADTGSYTWKTTTETANQGGFTPGPVEGKTQKDGLTMITTSFNDQ